jgi:NADPH-dependent F420 reductase
MNENEILPVYSIAIIGGTGREGKALGSRWAKSGYQIIIGSRTIEKARDTASEICNNLGNSGKVEGSTNLDAARQADIIVVTVPYAAHRQILEEIKFDAQNKVVIDVTVPLVPPKVTKVQMPPDGSASLEAKKILGENVQVVTAFQNISYENLNSDTDLLCDVLVCGGDISARRVVLELVRAAGLVGWDAGPLENSVVIEGLTSILIGINKQYGVQSAGIQITGILRSK